MAKRVYIIHGWGGSPKSEWIPWARDELERKGFTAIAPEMPDTTNPMMDTWIPFLNELVRKPDENTYFIGHSIGCQTIMRYLQSLPEDAKVGGVILVAPWMGRLEDSDDEDAERIAKPWRETPIVWEKVTLHTDKFVVVYSDNDPSIDTKEAQTVGRNLGAEMRLEEGRGHFSDDDNVTELPIILKEISRIAS